MELQDLHNYRSQWRQPRYIRYRDYDVYGASGRSYGGAWSLLALKTLEHFDMPNGPHFSESVDRLEVMVRIAKTVWNEAWLYEIENLDDDAKVESYLTAPHAAAVWERVRQELPADLPDRRGNHSYHIVVVDRDGNAITGTNTINSLPWGDGLFVDGAIRARHLLGRTEPAWALQTAKAIGPNMRKTLGICLCERVEQ
jgi:gamma-glutamyltranspeptidase